MSSERLTVSRAARELDVTRGAVKMAIQRGTLAAHRVKAPNAQGFYYVIDVAEVERYRREHLKSRSESEVPA